MSDRPPSLVFPPGVQLELQLPAYSYIPGATQQQRDTADLLVAATAHPRRFPEAKAGLLRLINLRLAREFPSRSQPRQTRQQRRQAARERDKAARKGIDL